MRVMGLAWISSIVLLSMLTVFHGGISYATGAGYKIGPADILAVSVFAGGEQQVSVELTVSEQGYVNFPFIGTVKASGMTSSDMERKMVVPLERDYFVNPQVHIQLKEYHSLHFFISGAVKKPGKYEMQAATKIMDLIAKAEGVTPDSGNVAYVMRDGKGGTKSDDEKTESLKVDLEKLLDGKGGTRGDDGKTVPLKVDLEKLLDSGDMSCNIALVPGDLVYIPFSKGLNQSDSKVYVSGEVVKPDIYQYQPGMSALSVCTMAGGFSRYAAPNRTTIVRIENGKQKVIKIDLEDVVKGTIPDAPLKPGDRINVPESWF
jgi:polysaccharide biosynthesis/export protein